MPETQTNMNAGSPKSENDNELLALQSNTVERNAPLLLHQGDQQHLAGADAKCVYHLNPYWFGATTFKDAMIVREQRRNNAGKNVRIRRASPPRLGALLSSQGAVAEVLIPGLVVIRGALSVEQQKKFATTTLRMGEDSDRGFYEVAENGNRALNAEAGRGRIYDGIGKFPEWMKQACNATVATSCLNDSAMPTMDPTHCLINYYATTTGLRWHRDIYENDGEGDRPIVGLSVGASCTFAYQMLDTSECPDWSMPIGRVTLRSGDAMIFGGPCRFVSHCIESVHCDDTPRWAAEVGLVGRLSYTFRDAPNVIGREEEFRFFKPDEHLIDQNAWSPKASLIGAQPSQSPKNSPRPSPRGPSGKDRPPTYSFPLDTQMVSTTA